MIMTMTLISCDIELIPNESLIDPQEPIDQETLTDPEYDRLFTPFTYKKLTIDLTIQSANFLQNEMNLHFENFQDYRSDVYTDATITYEDSVGTIEATQIGFRTRGNVFSRKIFLDENETPNMNHFKLKFNAFDQSSHPNLFGLEELDLKYNKNQDSTYMNEYYPLFLFESMGVLAQKRVLLDLYLIIDNQQYSMGIYIGFEPIDSYFISRRFMDEPVGDLYKVLWQQYGPATFVKPNDMNAIGIKDVQINYRPTYDLKTNKNTSSHESLIRLMDVLELEFSLRSQILEASYHVDYLARYFAVSFLLGNPDDFRYNANNLYVYFREKDDTFYMIPYDLDHSLGSGWDGSPVFTDQLAYALPYEDKNMLDNVYNMDMKHPLVDTLFRMDAFKTRYKNYILNILNDQELYKFSHIETIINRYSSIFNESVQSSMWSIPFGVRNLESYLVNKEAFIRLNL